MMTFVACVFSETDWTWCDIIFLETARDFHTSPRYPVVLKMVSEIDYSGGKSGSRERNIFLPKLKVSSQFGKASWLLNITRAITKAGPTVTTGRSAMNDVLVQRENAALLQLGNSFELYKLTCAATFKHLWNPFGQCLSDSWVQQSKSAAPSTVTKCRRAVDFQPRKK